MPASPAAAWIVARSSSGCWSECARRLARDAAPVAVYATGVVPELYSARAGCAVEHPAFGALDLGTLCVRKG